MEIVFHLGEKYTIQILELNSLSIFSVPKYNDVFLNKMLFTPLRK